MLKLFLALQCTSLCLAFPYNPHAHGGQFAQYTPQAGGGGHEGGGFAGFGGHGGGFSGFSGFGQGFGDAGQYKQEATHDFSGGFGHASSGLSSGGGGGGGQGLGHDHHGGVSIVGFSGDQKGITLDLTKNHGGSAHDGTFGGTILSSHKGSSSPAAASHSHHSDASLSWHGGGGGSSHGFQGGDFHGLGSAASSGGGFEHHAAPVETPSYGGGGGHHEAFESQHQYHQFMH